MATSSIHIQRATAGSAGHNSREHYSYSVVFSDEKNECTNTVAESYKTYRSELAIRSKAYTERTGQKLQKSAVTQLSAVINLEAHHTLKDLEPIKAELERLFDTKVYQMAIHRDEGKLVSKADDTELYSGKDFFMNPENSELFFDKNFTKPVPMENYEVVKNYHAHIEMMGLDSKGNAIRQKMNKVALQGLQTTVANTLQMERGKPREGYTKEEMKQIVAVVGKKSDYESTTLYAQKFSEVAKELRIFKDNGNKRKDTPKFKDQGAEREKGKREALAAQKELKAEMAKMKEQLQQAGAGRAEYAALEQLNRELKEQIKAKDLTIDQLTKSLEKRLTESTETALEAQNALSEAQSTISNQTSVIERLKAQNGEKDRAVMETAVKVGVFLSISPTFRAELVAPKISERIEETSAKERQKYETALAGERSEKEYYADMVAEVHHAYEHEPAKVQSILDRQQSELKHEAKPAYKTALQRRDEAYKERMGREPKRSYSGPKL